MTTRGTWSVVGAIPVIALVSACSALLGGTDLPVPVDGGADGHVDEGGGQQQVEAAVSEASTCDAPTADGGCAGPCIPTTTQCSGTTVQACSASGQWASGQTCPYVCQAGACAGVCVPTALQCSGMTPQTCDAQGQWESGTTCTTACVSGQCTGSCSPGTLRCATDGVSVQTCNSSGIYATTGTCPFVCSGAGQCGGVCSPGSTQCSGLIPQTCVAGQWQNGTVCPDMCVGGTCIGVCMPGATQCCRTGESCEPTTSGAGAYTATCDSSGQWSQGLTCPSVCPGFGANVPECTMCNGVATCAVYNGTTCVCP
jgi:hypothetical protein